MMLKLKIPAAPFLIAFILGPMLEDNFRQSLLMSRGSWTIFFSSPICWFFWSLIVVFVFVLVRRGLSIKLAN
jgi:putative tricarboxylic transport membrane protein